MIRIANKNDISNINVIGQELYDNFDKIYDISAYLENDKYLIYVYDSDGIKAFLIAYENVDDCELLCIVVTNKYRGLKIGSKLLNHLIINTNKNIILEVSQNNEKAKKLYEDFNFRDMAIRKKYYQDGSDAIIMKLVR